MKRLGAALLATTLASFMAAAEPVPVRVVTWNLLPRDSGAGAGDKTTAETARVLKDLNPDIVILEQVPDLLSCEDILQALKPANYQVAVFSSFRDPQTGDLSREQVAILSRAKASNPCWDIWQGEGQAAAAPGGYASAVIHLEDRNLGVFAVQLSDGSPPDDRQRDGGAQQAARESATRQLVQQLDALRESSNGVQTMIIAGDFNTTPDDPKLSREMTLARLERAGYANALNGLPQDRRITLPGNGSRPDATVDYLFSGDPGKFGNVQITPVTVSFHYPVAADLVFTEPPTAAPPAAVAAAPAVTSPAVPLTPNAGPSRASDAPATQSESEPSLAAFWQTLVGQIGIENIWCLAGLLAGGLLFTTVGFQLLARMARHASKLAVAGHDGGGLSPSGAGEILIMAPSGQTGSATGALPVVHIQAPVPAQMDAQAWQRRAEQAERRADQATDVVRRGLMSDLGRWLRGGAARRLVSDRAQLLEAQRVAALKIQVVDERLTKVEQHIEQRTREYERRISELEVELADAREENRELIREKIAQVRAEMERERASLLQNARVTA